MRQLVGRGEWLGESGKWEGPEEPDPRQARNRFVEEGKREKERKQEGGKDYRDTVVGIKGRGFVRRMGAALAAICFGTLKGRMGGIGQKRK
jgi:hypothetical protein